MNDAGKMWVLTQGLLGGQPLGQSLHLLRYCVMFWVVTVRPEPSWEEPTELRSCRPPRGPVTQTHSTPSVLWGGHGGAGPGLSHSKKGEQGAWDPDGVLFPFEREGGSKRYSGNSQEVGKVEVKCRCWWRGPCRPEGIIQSFSACVWREGRKPRDRCGFCHSPGAEPPTDNATIEHRLCTWHIT